MKTYVLNFRNDIEKIYIRKSGINDRILDIMCGHDGTVIGVIIIIDGEAYSVKSKQEEIQERMSAYDKIFVACQTSKDFSNYEKREYEYQLNKELLNDLINLGKSLVKDGKVFVELF